jgi:RHS repeat-associated protein
MTLEYVLGDHLGSTSILTDDLGAKVSEMRYKPWGEVRYSWKASASHSLADYTFTGQYSYMDDPSTSGVTGGFDLMFYNARWYDPSLGRFAQADSIVPAGVQGYDRYAYVNNNPIVYNDPSGHAATCDHCGGASLENTLLGFKKYGKHGATYNNYYVAVYNAEVALAESLSGGITKEELQLLDAHEQAVENEHIIANNSVKQSDLTESMLSEPLKLPMAYRAAQLGFGYVTDDGQIFDWGDAGVAFAGTMLVTKKGTFELSGHAEYVQMTLRGVTVDQVKVVIENNTGFFYWHEGQLKQGFYSSGQKIFVASTEDGVINTVMTNIKGKYIGDLRNKKP